MSAVVLPFDPSGPRRPSIGAVRVSGGIGLRAVARGGRCVVADLRERDGYKVRMPRGGDGLEAVIINTGGGVAGGDRVSQVIAVAANAAATVTTQSAERIYRALGGEETRIDVHLEVGDGAALNWLPQETILFDGSHLVRAINADIAATGHAVVAEATIFGRSAMGEVVRYGRFRDQWRIRHGGRLVFAETVRLEGDIARQLEMSAIGDGAHVTATAISVGLKAGDRLEAVRRALEPATCVAAASAWGPMLVVRMLGRSGESVRLALARVLPILTDCRLPRVWAT